MTTIAAVCPHCETALQLKPEMAGRQVRCPDCGEAFAVPPAVPVPPPLVAVARPVAPPPKPKEVRWTPEPAAKPKEVRWSEVDLPATKPPRPPRPKAPPPSTPRRPSPEPEPEPAEPIRSRAKKANRSPMVLAGLLVALLSAAAGFAAVYHVRAQREEGRQREEAAAAYAAGEYAAAKTKYEALAADHADSEHGPRYAFLARLSAVQASALTMKAGGAPAEELGRFLAFMAERADDPLAKPGSGFGNDIVILGQKLATLAHDHADGELKRYAADRDPKRLADAERIAADGREVLTKLERFRDKDSPASTEVSTKYDTLAAAVAVERRRADAIAAKRGLLDGATYARIAEFEEAMRLAGLGADAEVLGLAAAARKQRLGGIRFISPDTPVPPAELKLGPAPALAVSFLPGSPKAKAAATGETVFGLANGCLYALDGATGELLWARRVAEPTADRATFDVPVHFGGPSGDAVLVNVRHGGVAGIAALAARTGEPHWFQPLPPAFARPAVVGARAYLGLRDPEGTIIELDLATAEKRGEIALGLPLAAAPVALPRDRAGTRFVLAVCESERAILLECGRDAPIFAKSFFTGHAAGAVLAEPIVLPAAEQTEGPKLFLVLAAGPARSVLAGYRLPLRNTWTDGVSELHTAPFARKEADGWPWFPALADGDRLAFATDAGRVRWYGTAAAEPYPLLPETAGAVEVPARAAAVAVDDDSLWVVAGGELVRYRAAVGRAGPRMVKAGAGRPVGEVTCRPQRTATAAVVNLQPAAGRPQVLAFDPDTGDVRWRVELVGSEGTK